MRKRILVRSKKTKLPCIKTEVIKRVSGKAWNTELNSISDILEYHFSNSFKPAYSKSPASKLRKMFGLSRQTSNLIVKSVRSEVATFEIAI